MKHTLTFPGLLLLQRLKHSLQFISGEKIRPEGRTDLTETQATSKTLSLPNSQASSYIESYGAFLPKTTMSTRQTVKDVRHVKFIPLQYVTGIKKRRVTSTLSAYDLAALAVEKCLSRSRYLPEDIDLVINCNICKSSADGKEISYEPTTALKLSQAFHLKNATCFDLNNACAGMFTAIHLANQMIREGSIRRALIVSGERISHLTTTAQREIKDLRDPRLACLTLGDAGAAILLDATADATCGIMHSDMKTLSEHSRLCLAFPSKESHGGIIMHTQSKKLTTAGRIESANFLFEKLSKNAIKINRKSLIITHQVSKGLPPKFAKRINELSGSRRLRKNQMFNNVETVGNTASTAHIVAFAKALASKRLKKDDEVIFVTQASGLVIGVLHYKLDDLPNKISRFKKRKSNQVSTVRADHESIKSPGTKPRIAINTIATFCEQPTDTVDMAAKATASCLAHSKIGYDQVNYLIHAGQYRSEHIEEPSHAALIAGQLQLSHSQDTQPLLTFDITNSGLGWLNAVHSAATLIDRENAPNIVITASECDENKKASLGQPLNISELATATLLTPSNGSTGFSHFHFRSFTDEIDLRVVKFFPTGADHCHVITECPSYEDKLVHAVVKSVREQLAALSISLDEFAGVILPQNSNRLLLKMADELKIPASKLIDVSGDTDHFSSSVPLALRTVVSNSQFMSGSRILIVDAAPGIQVGMAIYTM